MHRTATRISRIALGLFLSFPVLGSVPPGAATEEGSGLSITIPFDEEWLSAISLPLLSGVPGGKTHVVFEWSSYSSVRIERSLVGADLVSVGASARGASLLEHVVEGSAIWSGGVVAVDLGTGPSRRHLVVGDAEIQIDDFTTPIADISFTGLTDLETGAARDDIAWTGLEVADGHFFSDGESGTVDGRFYGPVQQDVAGTFLRDQLHGAFQASRPAGESSTTVVPGSPPVLGVPGVPIIEVISDTSPLPPVSPEPEPPILSIDPPTTTVRIAASATMLADGFGTMRFTMRQHESDSTVASQWEATSVGTWLGDSGGAATRSAGRFAQGPYASQILDDLSWIQTVALDTQVMTLGTAVPSGAAEWSGPLVAIDTTRADVTLQGDASLVLADLASPLVDISLRNIYEVGRPYRRTDVIWQGVPIRRGAFHADWTQGLVDGRFHGTDAETATGTFYFDSVAGSFSARRPGVYTTDIIPASYLTIAHYGTVRSRSFLNGVVLEDGVPDPSIGLHPLIGWGSFGVDVRMQLAELLVQAGQTVDQGSVPLLPVVGLLFQQDMGVEISTGSLPGGNYGYVRFGQSLLPIQGVSATFAYGLPIPTNPTGGSARWSGEAMAFDMAGRVPDGNEIRGKASLVIDNFEIATVDVAITDLLAKVHGVPVNLPDLHWNDLRLRSGAFRSQSDERLIEGQIYGAQHSHFGGVFEGNGIVGAFGAQRMP